MGKDMDFQHIFVSLIAAAFAIISTLHGIRNARNPNGRPADPRILYPFYAVTLLWSATAAWIGKSLGFVPWIEALIALCFVGFVHAVRVISERSGTGPERPETPVRYLMDMLANYATITFAIFGTQNSDLAYGVWTLFFGLMFIGKELRYRIKTDLAHALRGWGKRRSSEPAVLRSYREFFSNFCKSAFYIVMGWALAYAGWGTLDHDVGVQIGKSLSQGQWPAMDALYFGARGFFFQNDAGGLAQLGLAMFVQTAMFLVLTSFIVVSVRRGRN